MNTPPSNTSVTLPCAAARRASIWRYGVLTLVVFGSLVWILNLDPLPQDTNYHLFADNRTLMAIPHFLDVASNLPFLIVGVLGLRYLRREESGDHGLPWSAFFIGVSLVSIGSAYYHLNPTNQSLVWDRLPMSIAFMGLFAALANEYLGQRLGALLLAPAIALGIGSVLYWAVVDDLRAYYWVQLVPMLTVPTVMILFRRSFTHEWLLPVALAWYGCAKVAELYDQAIFMATRELISGHSMKHLLAAVGCFAVLFMLQRRNPIDQERRNSQPLESGRVRA